jgi:parvulin-like peptidyl-prolyl isomerase
MRITTISLIVLALTLGACSKSGNEKGSGSTGQSGSSATGTPKEEPAVPTPPAETGMPEGAGKDISSLMPASGGPATPPPKISVAHVLIAVKGGGVATASRTEEEARDLATQIMVRARMGEDFDALAKEYSEDPGGGPYTMANHGQPTPPGGYARSGMVAAFGDVGFRLNVGEIGMAPYHAEKSPFGFHVIKRVQ